MLTYIRKTAREFSEAVRAFSYGRFSTSSRSLADVSGIVGARWIGSAERSSVNFRAVAPRARKNADRNRAINRHQKARVSNTVDDQILCSEPQLMRELTC